MRKSVLSLALVFGLSGCATMFASGPEPVTLTSEPSGARVTTQTGMTLGVTPVTTQLEPKSYVLTFNKEGYEPAAFTLGKKVDGAAFLNLLCVLCWGIDFATGALWGLDTNQAHVTLSPATAMLPGNRQDLACANYDALRQTEEEGKIKEADLARGEQLVAAVTGVPATACERTDPAL